MKIGIVGCSINGAYLASRLAKEHDVTIFEKKKKVGGKPCSGLVSERIWNFIPKDDSLVESRIDGAIMNFPGKIVKLKFHPKMLVLDRDKLDCYVASLAERAGAKILLGNGVKKVYFMKNAKPQVHADSIYEFDFLIGCDGFDSIVRKSVGIRDPKYKLGIYGIVKKKNAGDFVDVFPSKSGFGWIMPRGQNVEYGFMDSMDIAKRNFDRFCKSKRASPKSIYSHVIPQGLVRAEKGRVALCGDALGLTKPTSGGGIIWGLIACNILIKSFPNLNRYGSNVRKFFEPKFLFAGIGNRVVRLLGDKAPILLPKEVYFDSDILY